MSTMDVRSDPTEGGGVVVGERETQGRGLLERTSDESDGGYVGSHTRSGESSIRE